MKTNNENKTRVVWISDIHLDHFPTSSRVSNGIYGSNLEIKEFCNKINSLLPDSVIITGDLSTAKDLINHLEVMEETILPGIPVYFVLGNHDYYGGSIVSLRSQLEARSDIKGTNFTWLTDARPRNSFEIPGCYSLSNTTALVGHDGWYDGGYSDWFKSDVVLADYDLIQEFRNQSANIMYRKFKELAEECANHIKNYLSKAAAEFDQVFFATHVPPFQLNSLSPDGKPSDKDWLPVMSSKIAGDAILKIADKFQETSFVCLSGHTHTASAVKPRPNLVSLTANSRYKHPEVSIQILEIYQPKEGFKIIRE